MQNIAQLSLSAKNEIAALIKADTLETVNQLVKEIKPRDSFYTRHGKRWIDMAIGLVGFTVSLPINLVIGIVTIFDVGRPIIFVQERRGYKEKVFKIYKFRNMTNKRDANGELLPPAERVTKWGKFVRKTSLDELLNFVPILKGDMSIIGPRPLLEYYVDRLHKRHRGIYAVRPGLECPTLKPVDHVLSWQERLENYVWYAENCSFLLDLKLMFRVIAITFDRKAAAVRSNAYSGGLLGYDFDATPIYTVAVPDKYVSAYLEAHGFANLEEAIQAKTMK